MKAPAPTLEQCEAFALKARLKVHPNQDRKSDGSYVTVYLVYRHGTKEGKSRSLSGLLKLLKRLAPGVQMPTEPAAAAAPPIRRSAGKPIKRWWLED